MKQQSLLKVRLLEVEERRGRSEGAAEGKPHTCPGCSGEVDSRWVRAKGRRQWGGVRLAAADPWPSIMAQCLTRQTPVVEPPRPLFMATGGLDRAEPFYFSRVNNSWPLARPPAGKQKQRRRQAGLQVASRTLHWETRLFFFFFSSVF